MQPDKITRVKSKAQYVFQGAFRFARSGLTNPGLHYRTLLWLPGKNRGSAGNRGFFLRRCFLNRVDQTAEVFEADFKVTVHPPPGVMSFPHALSGNPRVKRLDSR